MRLPRTAGIKLVLRTSVLTLITGCGVVTGTKAPQAIGSDPSSTNGVAPSGLQLGYVWQADSHNLYPIMGVAGSAHYGAGILPASPNVVTAAAASSASGPFALLLSKDGTVQELQLPSLVATTLTGGVPLDATISFSPSGTCAAFLSVSTRTIAVVSGLPLKPQIASLQLPAGSVPVAAAISDAGTILLGFKQSGSPAVQLATLSELHGPLSMGKIQGWGGAGFVPASAQGSTGEAVVIADAVSGQVQYIFKLDSASPSAAPLATAGIIQTPSGVGVSPDGKWAFVADSSKPQIVRVSLAASGPAPSAISCACKPREISPLTSNGVFSVGGNVSGQPAWILDTRTASPRTFFVPALQAASESQTGLASTAEPANGTSR